MNLYDPNWWCNRTNCPKPADWLSGAEWRNKQFMSCLKTTMCATDDFLNLNTPFFRLNLSKHHHWFGSKVKQSKLDLVQVRDGWPNCIYLTSWVWEWDIGLSKVGGKLKKLYFKNKIKLMTNSRCRADKMVMIESWYKWYYSAVKFQLLIKQLNQFYFFMPLKKRLIHRDFNVVL